VSDDTDDDKNETDDDTDDFPAHPLSAARRKEVTAIHSVIGDFMAELRTLTDGIDWDQQDAKVALARERAVAHAERERTSHRARVMLELGFPARALEMAQGPELDMSTPPLDALRTRYGGDDRTIVVLSGAGGIGKTVAACWWALHRSTRDARFVRAASFAASSRYTRAERSELLTAGVLVLDDLGAEYADAKGNLLTDLDELVDTFYSRRANLIITTNLPGRMFPERYGERIAGRIREAGRWIEMGGAVSRRPAPRQPPQNGNGK
jgi:DNA replication protein DnaC